MPVYPVVAKQAHVSGTVVLHCIIGKDGSVQALEYVSGPPLLMKSAMDAVRQWTYQPTLLNGEAVEVDTTVSVVFTLSGNTSNSTTDHTEPPPPPSAPAGQQERGAAKQSLPASSGAMPLEERVPESGSVTDNVYTNRFYGFTYEFPKGWSVPGEATKKYVAEMGKALSTGDDPTKKAMAEVAEKRMHQLLQAFEHPFGTPGQFNENIILVAQDVSYLPGIQKGSDYLLIVKAGITKIRPDLKVLREPTDSSFGGKTFSRMDVSFEPTIGITIYQAYVATIVNLQALGFTFTANKPERLATLVDTLNTLEFKPELARPSVATDAVSGLSAQSIPQLVMLTNSEGVDFQSYIMTIWDAVKPKWYTVMPESALHGPKGKVVLVFGIRKDGSISGGPKAEVSSGNAQLDEAAIAAIHLTAPFSPFPAKFKGKEIRLRIIFLYNLPAETVLN
jgi:TonB family protein